MNSHEKGASLEQAIKAIEEAILKASPELSQKSYKIYNRKIINVDGVTHEIDLWIEFDIANGYESIFIFEAKNWNNKVDKNELIVFEEKIKVAKAQKGFFVAKSFTKSAEAFAKNSLRMILLRVNEDFEWNDEVNQLIKAYRQFGTDRSKMSVHVSIILQPASLKEEIDLDIESMNVMFKGIPISFKEYINGHVDQMLHQHIDVLSQDLGMEGLYNYDLSQDVDFSQDGNNKLLINNQEVKILRIKVHYELVVSKPPIIAKYEIETRGRVYNFEPVKTGDVITQISLIELTNNSKKDPQV